MFVLALSSISAKIFAIAIQSTVQPISVHDRHYPQLYWDGGRMLKKNTGLKVVPLPMVVCIGIRLSSGSTTLQCGDCGKEREKNTTLSRQVHPFHLFHPSRMPIPILLYLPMHSGLVSSWQGVGGGRSGTPLPGTLTGIPAPGEVPRHGRFVVCPQGRLCLKGLS